ncbi:mucoidy inhibitor MuiA family protein [Corallococcus sp. EGB]|uniref:mucoidy inhibitor MuiA family protein n=1 Tax=Corallococcus sp. EGB TaxID=1521117 RepID=UPI001CBBB821|nr:mucoidy inhibitor MuiA family protein [Corallococcus sp. EGB]
MLFFGLGGVAVSMLAATTEAPITAVTVYSDRARVERTATVTVSGTQRVELPRLPDFVDPDSIRVEAQGAEVSSVDIRPASAPSFPLDSAKQLLGMLDKLDGDLARVESERLAFEAQLAALRQVQPAASEVRTGATAGERASSSPTTWSTSADFLVHAAETLQTRMLVLRDQHVRLQDERMRRLEEAARLGDLPRKPGLEVAVTLSGTGPAKVHLTYLVLRHVRWSPRYELQLQPEQQRVLMAFSGRVSQDTGEDWEGAKLTLSTALPSTVTSLPRFSTWKIGTVERFIPEPSRPREPPSTPPSLPARMAEPDLELELRRELLTRAGRTAPVPQPAKSAPTPSSIAQPPTNVEPFSASTLIGSVTDARGRQPVADAVVTATSPNLQGERTVVTDAQGNYRISQLPPGVYTLRVEKEQFRPHTRTDVQLRLNRTIRVNMELVTESHERIEVISATPTIEVGSTHSGVNTEPEFIKRSPESGYVVDGLSTGSSSEPEPVVDSYVGLAPPAGWQPPKLAADLPASLAGGYDLAYTAQRPETVRSGGGERTVPLLNESWPVQVERHVFPALARDAYLVAQLKSPSRTVLPGGPATLFVGTDPAGTTALNLIVPGEPFALPLGVDLAVRTARSVRLVQAQEGFISKDDINTYEVTLEVPNPYPFPMPVRVVDQWPLNQDGKVEVRLLRTTPAAHQDPKKGELWWDLVVPPSSTSTVSFEYSLRRPQNWRLSQRP